MIGDIPALATDADTELNTDYTIDSLRLNRGADADTNGHRLDIEGEATVGGIAGSTSTRLVVSEHTAGAATTSFAAEEVSIVSDGELLLDGGRMVLAAPATASAVIRTTGNGILGGYGVLRFQDNLSSNSVQLLNSGTVQTSRPQGAPATVRYTLRFESSDPLDSSLLFSTHAGSMVNLASMTTLDVATDLSSNFQGQLNLAAGSIFDTTDSPSDFVRILSTGEINVNAGTTTPGVPSTATFRGLRLVLDPEAELFINSGTFVLEEGISTNVSSSINIGAGAGLQVDNITPPTSTFGIAGDININGAGASLTFNANLTISDPSFDWDGQEDAVTTVNSGARLTINSNDIETGAGTSFDGTINVLGGELRPNVTGGWKMSGQMNLNAGVVMSTEQMTVSGGTIVATGGISELDVPVVFTGSSSVEVTNITDRLELHDVATIEASTTFSGIGVLWVAGSGEGHVENGANVTIPLANDGDLHVASGAGTATALAFDQLDAGELFIEIGGTNSSQYDRLNVLSGANIDGDLNVSLINGFTPSGGQEFTILASAILSGQFDNGPATLPSLTGNLEWEIDYTSNSVVLRVLSPFSADFDNDGDVDGDDLNQWEGDFGLNSLSDADGDGDSDGADFLAWQQQFGSGVPPLASSRAVPEPATWLLLLTAACIIDRRGRQR